MFNRIIVPVDGSEASWRAAPVADSLAAACDAELEFLHVKTMPFDPATDRLEDRIAETAWTVATPKLAVIPGPQGVAQAIADHLDEVNGGVLVMTSSGRGRTQAVLGSVMSEVLALTFGPLVVVGPQVDVDGSFRGEMVVTVDGSELSESALGLAGAWGIGLRLRPWVVSVIEPGPAVLGDAAESGYVSRTAHHLAEQTGRDVEFEVLHSTRPAKAINQFAETVGAQLVVMATHGRGGLARLTLGSVAADVVRHSVCPVVLLRPPELALHHAVPATASATV